MPFIRSFVAIYVIAILMLVKMFYTLVSARVSCASIPCHKPSSTLYTVGTPIISLQCQFLGVSYDLGTLKGGLYFIETSRDCLTDVVNKPNTALPTTTSNDGLRCPVLCLSCFLQKLCNSKPLSPSYYFQSVSDSRSRIKSDLGRIKVNIDFREVSTCFMDH